MKKMMTLMILGMVFLSACVAEQGPAAPTSEEEPVLEGCAALPTYKATLATQKQTLEEEQKELLKETDERIQRLQKFKVLKLDREVKELEQNITTLEAQC